MKKFWLVMTISLGTLALVWCNWKNNDPLDEAVKYCLNNGWTHSLIDSSEETYGECLFPSWIWCRDDIILAWECNFKPDISNIDNEEKRLTGCDDNVNKWIFDFEKWENININWEDENEGWANFVRSWVAHYIKDWSNRKINVQCIADFVDWSISTLYSDPIIDE